MQFSSDENQQGFVVDLLNLLFLMLECSQGELNSEKQPFMAQNDPEFEQHSLPSNRVLVLSTENDPARSEVDLNNLLGGRVLMR